MTPGDVLGMSKALRFLVNLEGFSPNLKSASKEMMLQLPLSPTICRKWYMAHGTIGINRNASLQGISQISFEVVAVFSKHHQKHTGIPNHFALPGVHGHDSNKRHRICNGTLALGCGYCGGFYKSCSHGRHGRRQGYCTVPFEQNSAKLSKCVINSYGMALTSAIITVQVVKITPFR